MKYLLSGKDWKVKGDYMSSFISATVPGIVQQDLIDNMLTTDFWYGNGPEDKYEACQHDWTYIRGLYLNESWKNKRLTLVFESVDFTCKIYVNDRLVGENNGEYLMFFVDITDAAVVPGNNVIRVEIEKMPPELLPLLIKSDGPESGVNSKNFEYWFVTAMNKTRQRLCGLKSIATYSYDWSSNLYTLGIQKDVRLIGTNDVRIDWLKYSYSFSDDYKKAVVGIEAEVNAFADTLADFRFVLTGPDGKEYTALSVAELKKGTGFASAEITVENPDLWWPAGHGGHPLYGVKVQAVINGKLSDERTEKIGLREVVWGQCEGLPADFIHPFALHINGRLIRTFGSCMVTIDAFKGHEGRAMQEYLAELALKGNMNVIRVHGGQSYYYNFFHDYCDEHGLMLIMDMPFGNCVPEDLPGMYDMYRATVSNFIRQLRRHPCIIEWTGGNEMGWYTDPKMIHPALQVMLDAAKECDPQRLFRSTCPIVGSRHGHYDYNPDNHYEEYDAMLTDNVNNAPMQRNGEFSCSTPGNIELWRKYIPPVDRFPLDQENDDLIRKNVFHSINPEMWMNLPMIERMFGKIDNLDDTLRAGQYMSGEGLRYAMDSFRRRGKKFSGFSTWGYNEPAPNGAGCGLVNYQGQVHTNYYMTKEAMAPLSISLKTESIFYNSTDSSFADVYVTSDLPDIEFNLRWKWTLRDRRGRIIRTNSGVLPEIGSVESVKVDTFKINPPIEMKLGPVFAELKLEKNGKIVSERVQFFAMKGVTAPLGGLIRKNTPDTDFFIPYTMTGQCGGGFRQTELEVVSVMRTPKKCVYRIRNTGEQTALCCMIKPYAKHIPMLFVENNFVSVPSSEEREITLESFCDDLTGVGITVEAFNTPEYTFIPDETVAIIGRMDDTSEEFADIGKNKVEIKGKKADSSEIGYICDERTEILFDAEEGDCRLELGITDCSPEGTEIEINLNGSIQSISFKKGYGLKKKDKYMLCRPERKEISFGKALCSGRNSLIINVVSGWFAWDGMLIKR